MTITRTADNYRQGINALGLSIQQTAWNKGQIILTQERNNADLFKGEDEDFGGDDGTAGQGVSIGNQMISKDNIMDNVFSRVAPLQTGGDSVNVPAAGGETSGGVNMEAEVTIKDIIENRQEQLRDLE